MLARTHACQVEAEARLEQLGGVRKRSKGRAWRLSAKAATQRHADQQAADTPTPPPPPDDAVTDPASSLMGWLSGGGTAIVCRIAAKSMVAMAHKETGVVPPDSAVEAATKAASDAAALAISSAGWRPGDSVKAALDAAAAVAAVAVAASSLDTEAARRPGQAVADAISNVAAREWWATYIGAETMHVRSQLLVDAFVLWMSREGLQESEAQVFGALAAAGCVEDQSGDVTVAEFGAFAAELDGFTLQAVRSCVSSRCRPGNVCPRAQLTGGVGDCAQEGGDSCR
jgi:hypothetical protein